jgi:2,4-dienoyl-CoA reductase (NADPH2)
MDDPIFQPLAFRNLNVKNRLFRSSIAGRFDNWDGSGNPTRINWELKFARGGVGAIVSAHVPVQMRGRILPGFATIDRDERVPFWRELGKRVHQYDCAFLMQLSHGGRQRDVAGIEWPVGLSSTDRPDSLHGFPCERMDEAQIRETIDAFAVGARRAREAGLDGVELHASNGYLITQFLSSAVNDRVDGWGGPLEHRARFLLEIVAAIRREVGRDFHLQVKLSATDHGDALFPWEAAGNTVDETVQVCRWLEEAGVDAIHVSTGHMFPHPRNPPGAFAVETAAKTYDAMLTSGIHTRRNYFIFRHWPLSALFKWWWERRGGGTPEGINLDDTRAIKRAVKVPVLCTGGFQTASVIRRALAAGDCDAVSMARPLVANPDLPRRFAAGEDRAPRPCTYCNKCLVNVLKNPLGCYEEARFDSREQMLAQILSVFDPPPFTDGPRISE